MLPQHIHGVRDRGDMQWRVSPKAASARSPGRPSAAGGECDKPLQWGRALASEACQSATMGATSDSGLRVGCGFADCRSPLLLRNVLEVPRVVVVDLVEHEKLALGVHPEMQSGAASCLEKMTFGFASCLGFFSESFSGFAHFAHDKMLGPQVSSVKPTCGWVRKAFFSAYPPSGWVFCDP